MGEEQLETKKDVASETKSESKSTDHVTTPPPEPKSSLVATPPPEKTKPPHGGDNKLSDTLLYNFHRQQNSCYARVLSSLWIKHMVFDTTDVGLEIIVAEKKMALIKAWEENEKTKADNKAYTKKSAIGAWENTKRAAIEAELKQIEENIQHEKEKQKEKMKNKMAAIHKEAEEKRALVEAKRGQDIVKAEEAAAKFHTTGTLPSKLFKCFGY